MATLVYSVIASLDLYVEDAGGKFDWAEPDEEMLAVVNDLERPIGGYLYGRRMYDTMKFWQAPTGMDDSPGSQAFATIWQAAEKIVYSRTLSIAETPRTRIEPEFDPAAVRALKENSPHDLSIGGAELAGLALTAGLVDEVNLLLHPVLVGAGKAVFPVDQRIDLELVEQRRFDNGAIHLHYRIRPVA
jgi:dihydrofolate reductase